MSTLYGLSFYVHNIYRMDMKMKTVRTIEELIMETDSKKRLIIYGAGQVGKLVYGFLRSNGITVTAFSVTMQIKEWSYDGIPVRSIDDILDDCKVSDIIIILSVTKTYQTSMEEELKKRKTSSYIKLSEGLIYELRLKRQKEKAKEAELKKEIIEGNSIGYLTPGYLDTDYAERRVVVDKIKDAFYVAMPKESAEILLEDKSSEIDWERYRQSAEACYCPKEYCPEVDLVHTFNMVCKTDRAWIASFETTMPRIWPGAESEEKYYLQLAGYMKQSNCKMLYAFCRNAYNIQRHNLMRHLPLDDVELLMAKTKVLHPPQEILITEEGFVKKHKRKEIHFIFVGSAFFIKGGRELIRVLSKFENYYDFRLTLVSNLLCNDYFTKTSNEEATTWKEIIQKKQWIDYYESIPNDKVLEKCTEATIGLLPSFADTYGYAVLEMQASGCPVVTTNVRALSEINNEKCGWVCQMPIDDLGYCTEQDKTLLSDILEKELEKCFQDIFEHPDTIEIKGRAALERIREMHDPDKYQRELKKNLE